MTESPADAPVACRRFAPSTCRRALDVAAHCLPVATAELERVAAATLDAARQRGATAAETAVSQGVGQDVTVRHGEVETIAYHRDRG